MTQKGFC